MNLVLKHQWQRCLGKVNSYSRLGLGVAIQCTVGTGSANDSLALAVRGPHVLTMTAWRVHGVPCFNGRVKQLSMLAVDVASNEGT